MLSSSMFAAVALFIEQISERRILGLGLGVPSPVDPDRPASSIRFSRPAGKNVKHELITFYARVCR